MTNKKTEDYQKMRNIVALIFLTILSIFSIYSIATSSNIEHNKKIENKYIESALNKDGTFVLTKDGLKKDFTNTTKKVDWYSDPFCGDCINVHEDIFKDVKQLVKEGKIEVKFHELNFLSHRQTSNYSMRYSSYILGMAKYAPDKVIDALDIIYSKRFKETWQNDSSHNGFKALTSVLGIAPTIEDAILREYNNFEKMVDENSRGIRFEEKMKELSPKGTMFTPFVVLDGYKAFNAEEGNPKETILKELSENTSSIPKSTLDNNNSEEDCVNVCV